MPTLSTQIREVAVYPDRARVTRTGELELEPGAQTVTISNLPRQLDETSVRATGQGQARLTGVQVNLNRAASAPPGAAQEAQDKLQALLDQDQILNDEAEAWKTRLQVIKSIGENGGETIARNVARGKLSLDGLTGALDYLSNSFEAAATVLRDLAIRRRDLDKQIQAARQQADKLQNAAATETYEAQVSLDVQARGPVSIELTYAVAGASWEALYDARLDGDELEWNYLAQVRQSTGEHWELPFALTLSTATLATGLDKPELPPWRIDAYRPPEPRMYKTRSVERGPMMAAAPVGMPAPEMAKEMAAPQMLSDQAEVESGGVSVTYRIATPRAIPADGEPHQVNLATLHFAAALDYFCAPKVDEHAFVRAKFTNRSDYVMLAGEASLYHGADFVGTRSIESIAPNQEAELFLGAEDRIQVERQETERSVDKTLLGNTGRTNLAYRIQLKNHALDRAALTVLDQIPVSQHPDIKVKLRDANPKPARQNEQGELAWELNLTRGQAAEINWACTVEFPKELRLQGL